MCVFVSLMSIVLFKRLFPVHHQTCLRATCKIFLFIVVDSMVSVGKRVLQERSADVSNARYSEYRCLVHVFFIKLVSSAVSYNFTSFYYDQAQVCDCVRFSVH